MNNVLETTQTNSIILTTGMFDLLKDQIRRKKLSLFNEGKLIEQLKSAKQVLRNQLPDNVVDIHTKVVLTDLDTQETITYTFMAPDKAKQKNKTISILSPVGLALIGYAEGVEVPWEMPDGIKHYRIEQVSRIK